MKQIYPIKPTGRINRRDLPNKIGDDEVLVRENFWVVGNGEDKRNQKLPGANRFSAADTGTSYVWGTRYYSLNIRKTFSFNNGHIYFIDDNGNETQINPPFSPQAIPASEVFRVSSVDKLLFSDGVNGMWSHDGNAANIFQQETAVTINAVGLLSHLDRMFAFEEDSEDLLFSKNLDPTNFTDSTDAGLITIGPRRGSKIMQIALLGGTIYIFKQDSIWRLTGRTPSEFQVDEVHPYLGCSARRSVVNTESGIIFQASDFEFYFFGGTVESTILLTYKIAISGDMTKNLVPIINRDLAYKSVATYHNKIYRCSMVENGGTTQTIEYCFNTVNETDFITRDFNISCYIKWDRSPDKGELFTGRADLGRLMKQYIGLNTDNGATSPNMRFQLQTKFVGSSEPRNIRFKRAYFNVGVLAGAQPIPCYYYLDCRTAQSDSATDDWATRGEYKSPTSFITINSQRAISSRVNLDYGKSKGQNISFYIDYTAKDIDFELESIQLEALVKPMKFSEKVGA